MYTSCSNFKLLYRYARIEISASSPIVPFRETIVPVPQVDMVNETIQGQAGSNEKWREFEDDDEVIERGLVRIYTPSKKCMVQVRALPLPQEVSDLLDENQTLIKTIDQYVSSKMSGRNKGDIQIGSKLKESTKEAMKEFKDKLETLFKEAGKQWKGFVEHIWAFGPKRVGPNLLVNKVEGYNRTSVWDCLMTEKLDNKMVLREYDYSVISGFQLATLTGPLCDEPMRGVCFIIESWEVNKKEGKSLERNGASLEGSDIQLHLSNVKAKTIVDQVTDKLEQIEVSKKANESNGHGISNNGEHANKENSNEEIVKHLKSVETNSSSQSSQGHMSVQGYVSGQLMSIVKDACQKSFQTQPQRLMAAMYKCTIQATTEVLGGYIVTL